MNFHNWDTDPILTSIIAGVVVSFLLFLIKPLRKIWNYFSLKRKIKLEYLDILPIEKENGILWYAQIKITNNSEKDILLDTAWSFNSKLGLNDSMKTYGKLKISARDYDTYNIWLGKDAPPGEKITFFIQSTDGRTFDCQTILKYKIIYIDSGPCCNGDINFNPIDEYSIYSSVEYMRHPIKTKIKNFKNYICFVINYNWKPRIKRFYLKIRYEKW